MYNTYNILHPERKKVIEKSEVLNRVAEYDIFAKYIGNFKIGHIYNSPLREDKNPSFGIFVSNRGGTLLYKDMASGECGDVFDFVKRLKGLKTYGEAIEHVWKELNIESVTDKMSSVRSTYREKHISVVRKPMSEKDLEFWMQFGITKDTLKIYKVDAIRSYLTDGVVKAKYSKDSPMYCYKVFNKFKIYRPFEKKIEKWRGNLNALDVQGFEQLPESGDCLIITKSLKDVMTLKELGYVAIAPSSESTKIPSIVADNIKGRFKKIIMLYDRDITGMKFARQAMKDYNFDFVFINKKHKAKDISDFVKEKGLEQAANLLKEIIR